MRIVFGLLLIVFGDGFFKLAGIIIIASWCSDLRDDVRRKL